MLGPRINAGGRVGKCSHGANLLLNKDPKNSFKLASELDQYNKERQLLEKNLLQKILNLTEDMFKDPVLILTGKDWHEGVIGIVAARLKVIHYFHVFFCEFFWIPLCRWVFQSH